MTKEIQNFITYMCEVKQISKNTELSYERDLRKMSVFLQEQGVASVSDVTSTNLNAYILYLEKEGRKPSTISRSIASMKVFFWLLTKKDYVNQNPAEGLKAPKIEEKNACDPDNGRDREIIRAAFRKFSKGASG